MAVSIYHKKEDILELPSYLLECNLNYRLDIRHYNFSKDDTVLFAYSRLEKIYLKAQKKSQMNLINRQPLQKLVPLKTPFVIYFDPSSYCNFKCSFCFHSVLTGGGGYNNTVMPLELANKSIDDMAGFPEKLKMIRICGFGEPLVNPHIIDIIKYLSEKNCTEKIVLVTNGSLLKPKISRELVKYLDHIIISVEGINEDQYLKFANVKINYEKFYNEVKTLCDYSKDEKCTICAKIHDKAVKTKEDLDVFMNLYSDICDEITIENLVNLWHDVIIEDDKFSKFRYENLDIKKKNICPQMFKGFQINADGTVVACCVDWRKQLVIGNVNNEHLIDIWNGNLLRELQIRHLNLKKSFTEPCKRCTMNDYSEVDYLDDDVDEIKKRMNV